MEMKHEIQVLGSTGGIKAQASDENQVILVWEGCYEDGDKIIFKAAETGAFYVIRVDDGMDEAVVYVTEQEVVYDIPFDEKKTSYNPKAFTGTRHYLSLRPAKAQETAGCRNLAKNVMDQHGDRGCFPHASANVETRGEAVFAARNAIDGVLATASHGEWPYQSWGINRQDDAELTLEFGRPVDVEQVVLYTRADFPHDNWWIKGTLTFSDGTEEAIALTKTGGPQEFPISRKGITWLKLGNLIKADDPSPFPALTQIEVYGAEAAE